jgi:hypothetical protein
MNEQEALKVLEWAKEYHINKKCPSCDVETMWNFWSKFSLKFYASEKVNYYVVPFVCSSCGFVKLFDFDFLMDRHRSLTDEYEKEKFRKIEEGLRGNDAK